MEISAIDYSYASIPSRINCEDCNKSFEENDSNDDGQLTVDEIGEAASLSISNAIPKESIESQELQDDIVNVFENLKNNKISQNEFDDFLKDAGLKTYNNFNNDEDLLKKEEELKEENQDLKKLSSALYELNKENDNTKLSSFASMMDKINQQTQNSTINEKLSAYTQNLRN